MKSPLFLLNQRQKPWLSPGSATRGASFTDAHICITLGGLTTPWYSENKKLEACFVLHARN